jgi:hypothetical protein
MSQKGSNFERQTCKELSRWWTNGKRDDVFWRSQTSGGRATQRLKSGKTTYGSYGDIAAVDPIGAPLLEMFTIELKAGRSHGMVLELIEGKRKKSPFLAAIRQARRACDDAGSFSWMLISHRDHMRTMVYLPKYALVHMEGLLINLDSPWAMYRLIIGTTFVRVFSCPWDAFLKWVKPEMIKRMCKRFAIK